MLLNFFIKIKHQKLLYTLFDLSKKGSKFEIIFKPQKKIIENNIRDPYYPLALDIKIYELTKDGDEILVFDKVATPNDDTYVIGSLTMNIKGEEVRMVQRHSRIYFVPENKTYKAVITNLIDDDNIRGDFSQLQSIEEKFNKEKV